MDLSLLQTNSLRASPYREQITRILAAALNAVEPAAAVKRHMRREGDWLIIGKSEQRYHLAKFHRVFIIGFGKASLPMARAAAEVLGDFLYQSIVVTKANIEYSSHITPHKASHPVPDKSNIIAGQSILDLLHTATPDDLVLCLISGGGSALLSVPSGAIRLDALQKLTNALLACGATIHEINALRKHLSQVKGGQIAKLVYPAQIIALILSDVVGNSLDVIASGPTTPDPTTFRDALNVLQKFDLISKTPPVIVQHLQSGMRGQIAETPKPGDPIFDRVQNVIIGSNMHAAQAALTQGQSEGFNSMVLTTSLQGEAQSVGKFLAATLRQISLTGNPISRPACVIVGGETTVTLTQLNGLGGRNQETALAAVHDISGLPNVAFITLATDGDDGPTDAAGAIATGETLARAVQSGLIPNDFLTRHDSYHFFDPLGDLLKIGLTHTNVNDLVFLFAF